MAVAALRAFDGSGPRRSGRRTDVYRRLWRGRTDRPPALDPRRALVTDRRPHPLGTIRVVRHGPRSLHQLSGGEPMSPENHATSRVPHQAVQCRVVRQTLEIDHRVHERRIIDGRGRQLGAVASPRRDQRGDKHDCEKARDHWQQRYPRAAGNVNSVSEPVVELGETGELGSARCRSRFPIPQVPPISTGALERQGCAATFAGAMKQDRGVPYLMHSPSPDRRDVDNVLTAPIPLSPWSRDIRRIGTLMWYKRCFLHVHNNLD